MQACLAAFEEVHAHHDHAAAHGTHASEGQLTQEVTPEDEQSSVNCGADCATSHLCVAQLLFLQAMRGLPLSSPSVARFEFSNFALLDRASERPERPQWSVSSY